MNKHQKRKEELKRRKIRQIRRKNNRQKKNEFQRQLYSVEEVCENEEEKEEDQVSGKEEKSKNIEQ